jgi:uncharacterized phage protein (TIGR02216 family)
MSGGGQFDWGALMAAGIGRLRLSPARFWSLTPHELRLMLGANGGPAPLDRAALEVLAMRFPDNRDGETR